MPRINPRLSKPITDIQFPEDLIAVHTAFRDQVYNPDSVLYPGCGNEASASKVYKRVTFVDIEDGNTGCVSALLKSGLRAFKQDIRDHEPAEEHDMLFLLNPAIRTAWAAKHIRSGAYILANDWHANATEMSEDKNKYALWGTINTAERDRRKGDNRVIVSQDLTGLFVPVKDASEFARLRPRDFEFAKGLIESWSKSGILKVAPDKSFEEKWARYREVVTGSSLRMPARRVADYYIFVKT